MEKSEFYSLVQELDGAGLVITDTGLLVKAIDGFGDLEDSASWKKTLEEETEEAQDEY